MRKRSSHWKLAALAAGGLASTACFGYVPVEVAAVPAGTEIRVHLTRQGLANLPEVPDAAGSVVTGTLLRSEPDRILVNMPVAMRVEGLVSRPIGSDIAIARGDIARIERRELSRGRTALALLAAAAAAFVVARSFGEGGDGGEMPPIPPPEESTRIPLSQTP